MEALENIKTFIDELDQKTFYKYLGIALGVITLCVILLMARHYSHINYLKQRINTINGFREDAKQILDKAQYVQQQRKEVDAMLAKDEDFKIIGYFEDLLTKLGLSDKKGVYTPSRIDRDKQYQESILNATFTGMNMKQVSQLLEEIEKNERIYAKQLEIIKSEKPPRSVNVSLTIATLQPKAKVLG